MFTGLLKKLEPLPSIVERGGNHRITINAPNTAKELKTGNSVAVSGVCLTALDITPRLSALILPPKPGRALPFRASRKARRSISNCR